MNYKVDANFQGNNPNFNGKFSGWWQCFSTSVWMFLGYFIPEINGTDDKGLSRYLDDVEVTIGKPGIGEKVKQQFSWITGRTSLWWLVQKAGIEKWMRIYGIKGQAVFKDKNIPFEELNNIIKKYGPVILQTNKMGGLKGGHIILLIGFGSDGFGNEYFIVNDPAGNATTNYSSREYASLKYPKNFLRQFTGSKIRCIYWD